MIIVHKINEFILELFPELEGKLGNKQKVKEVLEKYYTYQNTKPDIIFKEGWVEVHISEGVRPNIFAPNDYKEIHVVHKEDDSEEIEFKKAMVLCQKNNFNQICHRLTN